MIRLLLVPVSFFSILTHASAIVLAAWDVSGVKLNDAPFGAVPYSLQAGTTSDTSGILSLGTGVNPTTSTNQYGFKISAANQQSTLSGAIAADHYFEFKIVANAGFVLNLSSIELNGRSSDTGANDVAILSSIGGFSDGKQLASLSGVAGVPGGLDTDESGFGTAISLSTPAYQGIDEVTFRLYGWNSTSGRGTTYLRNLVDDDLIINGSTVAVPEPTLASLTGLALLSLLRRRR